MDYMLLGIKSRKTGLDVKENIKKDEYSMENVDDFFREDDTSLITSRDKSRRTSVLSQSVDGQILPPKEYLSPWSRGVGKGISTSLRNSTEKFVGNSPDISNRLDAIEEDILPHDNFDFEGVNESLTPVLKPSIEKASYNIVENDEGEDITVDRGSIKLTPKRAENKDLYNEVPDLIDDEEDTRDFTSLNTSENALLEDELDDDYVIESEEDRDYKEEESLLHEKTKSDEDTDGNSSDETSTDSEDNIDIKNVQTNNPRYRYGDNRFSIEVYDSDEEYIQKQATELNDVVTNRKGGLRRSNRVKVAPLEYWRNEKVVYKRKSNKPVLDIDKIVTFDHNDDDDEEELLKGRKRKKKPLRTRPYNYIPTGRPRGRPRKSKPTAADVFNPNAELLDNISSGKVQSAEWLKPGILEARINVSPDEIENEIVAFAPNLAQSEQIKKTEDESFSLAIMFDKHKDHFASGMLKLPINGKRKLSDSYRTYITFYVIQGIVEVILSGNVFLSTEGSCIQVPAFNNYGFENKGNNEVKMFFVQVTLPESQDELHDKNMAKSTEESTLSSEKPIRTDRPASYESEASMSSMSMSEI